MRRWKDHFLTRCQPPSAEKFPFLVIGNKCDLDDKRLVKTDEARDYADSEKMLFYEASAKNSTNVMEGITELC